MTFFENFNLFLDIAMIPLLNFKNIFATTGIFASFESDP